MDANGVALFTAAFSASTAGVAAGLLTGIYKSTQADDPDAKPIERKADRGRLHKPLWWLAALVAALAAGIGWEAVAAVGEGTFTSRVALGNAVVLFLGIVVGTLIFATRTIAKAPPASFGTSSGVTTAPPRAAGSGERDAE
jgi:hypothetical protein